MSRAGKSEGSRFAGGTEGVSQSGQSLGQAHNPIVCEPVGRCKGKVGEVKVRVKVKGAEQQQAVAVGSRREGEAPAEPRYFSTPPDDPVSLSPALSLFRN
jgi:hypothetical protein